MSKRKAPLHIWKPIKKVQVRKDAFSGSGVFSIDDLTKGETYEVYGMTVEVFSLMEVEKLAT